MYGDEIRRSHIIKLWTNLKDTTTISLFHELCVSLKSERSLRDSTPLLSFNYSLRSAYCTHTLHVLQKHVGIIQQVC